MAEPLLHPPHLPWGGVGATDPPSTWGPLGWHWLHSLAICYPVTPTENDREVLHRRLWSFIQTIPCIECQQHSIDYIRQNPVNASGGHSLQLWVWKFHNAVNARLGKPFMSLHQYLEQYSAELHNSYWYCLL